MRFARYALVTLVVAWSLSSVTEARDTELDAWNRLVDVVELIRNDPAAASLAAVDWWCAEFLVLRHPPDDFTKEAADLETFLISFVRTSTDDWLVDRIASSMADCFEEAWSPLFLDLLDAEDLELATAALRTLKAAQPPGALESLRQLAEQDDSPLRKDAVSALAAWPDDTEVMRLLVNLSRSEPGAIRDAALSSLSDFAQPEAIDRLVEVASDTTVGVMSGLTALSNVAHSDHPELIRVLSRLLDERTTYDTIRLQQVAYEGLLQLGVTAPDPASLLREFTASFTLSCGLAFDSIGTILPPVDGRSVRCWAAPRIAGDPEDYERLEAGLPVDINDHFQ